MKKTPACLNHQRSCDICAIFCHGSPIKSLFPPLVAAYLPGSFLLKPVVKTHRGRHITHRYLFVRSFIFNIFFPSHIQKNLSSNIVNRAGFEQNTREVTWWVQYLPLFSDFNTNSPSLVEIFCCYEPVRCSPLWSSFVHARGAVMAWNERVQWASVKTYTLMQGLN